MASILRSFLPVSTSRTEDHDDAYSVEYSFAVEYSGPPVSFDIPQVVPIDVHRIPIASLAAPASLLKKLSFPVIQPIIKSDKSNKESSQSSKIGSEVVRSLVSRRHSSEFQGSGRILPCNAVGDVTGEECASEYLDNGDGTYASGVSDESGSSDTLGFSDSHAESNEASGCSDIDDLTDKPGMGIRRSGLAEPANSEVREHSLSSPASSGEISSCEEEEDCVNEAASHQGNRTSVVTFCVPQSSEITSDEDDDNPEHMMERPVARTDVQKGLCYRCCKGSRITKKEVCVVCGAKYCNRCVLRAMGSMPEGRKCVTCIGFPIDESKRGYLGKSSKILKRLLTKEEIKQVMRLEISCEANQLPPHLVCVNGRPLSLRELVLLQNCRFPPKKLKPGKYWYDKVSGIWGKEGEKPCQIISPQLDVGDSIKRNASNGNTSILINGREITKSELWMLQLAGIHCEGHPHFWLSADGSFQEEGQKNVMGKLWDKSRIKFICAALSLPIPSESSKEVANAADQAGSKNLDQKIFSKILLVGCDQSGTSTIFKQAKILYDAPFSEDERQKIKVWIQSNLYWYIGILLEGRERFEEDYMLELRRQLTSQPGPSVYSDQIEEKNVYSLSPRLKAWSDWLLQVISSGNLEAIFPAATREYAPSVEQLLNDNGFQAAYKRRHELHALPRVANYFLDRAAEISREDYEPSDMDILYSEGITSSNGIASVEFSFPTSSQDVYMEPVDQNDPSMRYQLIRVHSSSLGENCKWLEMFEDVDLVLYCVSLTDYDEFHINSAGDCINKMLASRNLFEAIITHPTFSDKDFLLILNKFDLLEEKLERVPLSQCEWFEDFNPVISYHPQGGNSNNSNASVAQRAFHHVAVKFKRLFKSLSGRKLYVSPVSGLEANSVDEALKYGREVLKWEEERPSVCVNEWSSESIEPSTLNSSE